MTRTPFPYPGGKSRYVQWILDHIPRHECYGEVFAGAASVLVNKSRSDVEVINDIDGDIVHFFEMLRERPDELREWLRNAPYARELHEEWGRAFYDGERPDDPIERAGWFYYLRYTQFSADHGDKAGFSSARTKNEAQPYANGVERLPSYAERFRGVQIENQDFETFLTRFDGPDTFLYLDPPYVDVGDALYSHDGQFDQRRFVECLHELEAKWCVSYTQLPDGLDGYHIAEREAAQQMTDHAAKERRTERLVMNYDPQQEPLFVDGRSQSLGEVAIE